MSPPAHANDYAWDLFISYPRRERVLRWVSTVLAPQLEEELQAVGLGRPATVFRDESEIHAGQDWPESLAEAHARSRVVLAVLCFPFFESGWCCSEWRTGFEREVTVRTRHALQARVVVPVRFNDLTEETVNGLPDWVRGQVQARQATDLGRFTQLVNRLADTNLAHDFRCAIEELCHRSLKPALEGAPAWEQDWPRLPTEPIAGSSPLWKARLT